MTTLLTSLTKTNPGGGQLPYVRTLPNWTGLGAALAANTAYLTRVRVSAAVTVAAIKTIVGSASGNIDAGVYRSDGTTLTRLASAGSTAAAGSGTIQTLPLSATVVLAPGVDYYLAFAADNATVTILKQTGNYSILGALGSGSVQIATSFPLPATITLASTLGSSTTVGLVTA